MADEQTMIGLTDHTVLVVKLPLATAQEAFQLALDMGRLWRVTASWYPTYTEDTYVVNPQQVKFLRRA